MIFLKKAVCRGTTNNCNEGYCITTQFVLPEISKVEKTKLRHKNSVKEKYRVRQGDIFNIIKSVRQHKGTSLRGFQLLRPLGHDSEEAFCMQILDRVMQRALHSTAQCQRKTYRQLKFIHSVYSDHFLFGLYTSKAKRVIPEAQGCGRAHCLFSTARPSVHGWHNDHDLIR